MTQDEIIEMARQAGFKMENSAAIQAAKAFAKLVAAHTLSNIDPSKFISHQEGIETGRFAEREACAKVCDKLAEHLLLHKDFYGARIAASLSFDIRARGEQA
jgi:predicted acylesterase/phospholipase RssA